ncbi:MAG: dihydrodipicolinate synthase family protein [Verrucomicrobiota bacterium]
MNFTDHITGPVFPIPVPFEEDGALAEKSLSDYCRYLVQKGVATLLVTVGTSRFNLLSRTEMKRVNAIVAEATAGTQAISIASGPGPNTGSTLENLEFSHAAAGEGADAMIAVFPERWYGDTGVQDFFLRLADESPIPILIHAVPMRDGFGGVHAIKSSHLQLLRPLATHERIVGIKEENGDRGEYEEILGALQGDLAIIGAGGAMRRYQKDFPLGAKNYLVGIESVQPQFGFQFFEAMQEGRLEEAESLAMQQEDPFFAKAVELGWHRSLKAALAIMGLMPRHERAPFPALQEREVAVLREIIQESGWSL